MSDRVRVFVADDHVMFRQVLEAALAPGYDVVPGASTLREVDEAFERGGFDVAILDMSWGREGSVTPHLKRWYGMQPACHVIILTALDEYNLGRSFIDTGARGFLGKRSDFSEVLASIAAVSRGEEYFGRDLKPPPKRSASADVEHLPSASLRVLEFLSYGWSRKAIAKAMGVSIKTVDYHIAIIRDFFGVLRFERPIWSALFVRYTPFA